MIHHRLFFLTSLSLAPIVSLIHGGEKDKKMEMETSMLSVMCYKCDSPVLKAREINKDILYWKNISSPAKLTEPSDVSSLLPVSSLPPIHCEQCKELCCEPVWHTSGDKLKAAYKIIRKASK